MERLNKFFHHLNTSNYFIGLMMIMLNIGSKYLTHEFGSTIDFFFNIKIVRRLLIFTVFFIATRDVKTSIILTAAFVIIALELFNEKSKLCILPKHIIDVIDTNKDGRLSQEEIQHAMKTLTRAGYLKKQQNNN